MIWYVIPSFNTLVANRLSQKLSLLLGYSKFNAFLVLYSWFSTLVLNMLLNEDGSKCVDRGLSQIRLLMEL